MKNSVLYILLLFIGCCFSACHLIPEPATRPIPDIDSGPISLDFDYSNSVTKSGWVRFIDLSAGIVEYEWDFGFVENGEPAKSYTGAPKVRFPANGSYKVSVQGISYEGDTLTLSKGIVVNNY